MTEFISGDLKIRDMAWPEGFEKGETVRSHMHDFAHTSIFFNGRWHVRTWTPDGKPDQDFEREGPFYLLVEKFHDHEFTYLGGDKRGRAWCVFAVK
jgi:hypothetical protein